ncbi:MAG: glycosyltransferase [Verrucomicrobia bacterium]|nr:glycosyltransferase [Verrucomicrobiota bacterium]|tara:strand:- start:398 stop:1567 length:1170 start_codon:yes stop_codon:yes gene_type:complete
MKIGILLSRFPYPLEKGDKLRAFHQIKSLSKKHELYVCALSTKKINPEVYEKVKPHCKELNVIRLHFIFVGLHLIYGLFFSRLPLQVLYFYDRSAKNKIIRFFNRFNLDHLYCQLIRTSEYLKDFKDCPKTLDYMDALSSGMSKRIEKSPFYFKPFVKIEAKRLKRYEHFIFNHFDHKTIISEQDRKIIVHAKNDQIKVISNGVDFDYFKAVASEKKYDIIFTGNMSYPPNVTAASFLIQKVMPLLWQEDETLKVVIAGANPARKVKQLASQNVEVTGWMEDIRDAYATSKIFVAPMQIGSGLQNKLLEAMAMELPCITTELANNALNAIHNESILIANTAEEFANSIAELLKNENKRNAVAKMGNAFVNKRYNWDETTKQLEKLFLTK